ncbi:hypothetical protein LTR56_024728 [Elasticomyces elasticus]|nr:hypothetical protein LTR56_024728 [Elasticomyces elasticus]KAK3618600.1 hypothetical protein LTR22_026325 [Elasticomyces elasticus]KAK4908940.1 hypothetical protein LTR49_022244 [Elasticomyces elasticus]KAK5744463.1 hypothetical protein LTS12_023505 [Elasticomyces elasticus]
MPDKVAPCLLSLPSELRNAIYLYVFGELTSSIPDFPAKPDALAVALRFDNTAYLDTQHDNGRSAHLFDLRSRPLSPAKIGAIRHLTLAARISHLRALNEAWAGLPFGHPNLNLETLTIVPRKPDCTSSAYAEVADLSQSHTLAYIFAETFKGLRNIRTVEVLNKGCFNDVVWRIVYRSLVYRLWRWGGPTCGVRFECSPDAPDERDAWFRVHFQDKEDGVEVGEEVLRLAGGELPDPNTTGFGP